MMKAKRKRILLPLLYPYYLFEYLEYVALHLAEKGFVVKVVTFSEEVRTQYERIHDHINVVNGPFLLRALLGRSGKVYARPFLWVVSWVWSCIQKRRYDFVILPWDNKPIWYTLGKCLPSLSSHTTTEFMNAKKTEEKYTETESRRGTRVVKFIDSYLWRGFLPRVGGSISKYRPLRLIIDRVCGFHAKNYLGGFGGSHIFTVTGEAIRENYVQLGLRKKQIEVVGSPGYDRLIRVRDTFQDEDQKRFKEEHGLPLDQEIITFFLSPSTFSDIQKKEVMEVVGTLSKEKPTAFFVLKFHPKTVLEDIAFFKDAVDGLLQGSAQYKIVTDFSGDAYNAKLMLVSSCLVQKQCTLGFLAMMLRVPMISYNFYVTDYEDDMYEMMNGSWHVDSRQGLREAISFLETPEKQNELLAMQKRACEKYCLDGGDACNRISRIVASHLAASSRRVVQ